MHDTEWIDWLPSMPTRVVVATGYKPGPYTIPAVLKVSDQVLIQTAAGVAPHSVAPDMVDWLTPGPSLPLAYKVGRV